MANPSNPVGEKTARPRPVAHPNVRVLEGLLQTKKKKKTGLLKIRHWVMISGFFLLVLVPTALSSLYMSVIAADQYHSSTSFAVRSIDSAAMTSDILGMFSQSASSSTVADSYILQDYILSEKMVSELDAEFDLETIYAPRGLDFFFGLASHSPIEDQASYWNHMVQVNFDHASGIIQLTVKAFDPETARKIADFIVKRCENLINQLSNDARSETVRLANEEVHLAEKRLAGARLELRRFRDVSQEADPVEGAKLATQLVASMEQELARLNADLATARQQMAEDTPRIRVIKAQINSLETQIVQERQRLGAGEVTAGASGETGRPGVDSAVSERLQVFEELETQREFAQQSYVAALASLEKARIEAISKQRYLATFIQPTLSEQAQYPNRFLNVLLVFLGGLFFWGVGTLSYYNIRDRA
ncbi:RkpR, polysaccharide export protein [Ciceribacter sp. L1K22]|uniref:RkpR, polysaccharide export protein n=1 Tax=Ciceribacter sp. L1K22 TaxID=2820275 RepID=UPI001ABED40D|nr:RkpR, polysaccharide export protein [Ciceribacter sp. L1K22]MBO3762524.1 RkpR, polysaccharide export protein [Ciceribacter sp. L1K22]